MGMKQETKLTIPDLDLLRAELQRTKKKKNFGIVLRSTLFTLIVIAAISVLVATLWMPVLRAFGHSMDPTLGDGDIVITVKSSSFERGDLIAFYANNKMLIKRVIAGPGDWVVIDEDGTVYVNEERLEEPYINEAALGNCNIKFPYQVPESSWFVMGDHRETSLDSRVIEIGCIQDEMIVGRIVFRIWPLRDFGGF